MKKLTLLTLLGICFVFSHSQIINIPDNYPTIQEGIDAANNGDTVLVDIGTYIENISFNGKSITVASHYLTTMDTTYISQTVIDGDSVDTVIDLYCGWDYPACLCGFTITDGFSEYYFESGAGITVNGFAIIDNVIISDNYGSGMGLYSSNPIVKNCKFLNNTGYGIGIHHGYVVIENTIFNGNLSGINSTCFGASFSIVNSIFINNQNYAIEGDFIPLHISNSTFVNNSSSNDFSLLTYSDSVFITNCIFWNNSESEISGSPIITYSNIKGGYTGEGNIDEEPLFIESGNHPFQLSNESPCIDAGNPDTTGLNLPDLDIMGNVRILDGDGDNISIIDMGAYEYDSTLNWSCLPEGITFTTQAQIDSFQINYPNCTEIEGDVTIGQENWIYTDIENLEGLNVLTSIWGNLSIHHNPLLDLAGLENLTTVEGTLSIYRNDSLINLSGLDNLATVGEDLIMGIFNYPLGFGNQSLTNLTGLGALTSIGGSCDIICSSFTNLEGLNNLNTIGGDLLLNWNGSLTTLSGLENLTSIGGALKIGIPPPGIVYTGNDSLINLTGLNNLSSIGTSLEIQYNSSLNSLTGLDNLDAGTITDLIIIYNNSLSDCEANTICNYLSDPGGIVEVHHNAPNCNSPWEIASACGITLPCLPYGNYYFSTQFDIDNFQAIFPDCSELSGLIKINGVDITNLDGLSQVTTINGDLVIGGDYYPYIGNPLLSSLNGLENVTSFAGSLSVRGNGILTNLSGLENITTIGEYLSISSNNSLNSLSGINNLVSIGGSLGIGLNNSLISLTELSNLTSIGGDLTISTNNNLASLSGLNNLISIDDDLSIYLNNTLANFIDLNNLISIGGDLSIKSNNSLSSLIGLDNIEAASIGNLEIYNNNSLSNCHVESICEYLASPNGLIDIYGNAPGCNNLFQVYENCDESYCLSEGIEFTSQAQIDSFQINYPFCAEIMGDVTIESNDISNLNGLNNLTSIWEDVLIYNNGSLFNLTGVNNLVSIGGDLWIFTNNSLTNFSGLDSLESIGEELRIYDNENLISLIGLENLNSINGALHIGGIIASYGNPSLIDLAGLENIEAASIENLVIKGNESLSNCDAQCICDYLVNPNGTVEIFNNAPGCNSQQEVLDDCASVTSVSEMKLEESFTISPNPNSGSVNLRYLTFDVGYVMFDLFEISGVKVRSILNEEKKPGSYEMKIDLSDLPAGIYFCTLKTNDGTKTKKIIKL